MNTYTIDEEDVAEDSDDAETEEKTAWSLYLQWFDVFGGSY